MKESCPVVWAGRAFEKDSIWIFSFNLIGEKCLVYGGAVYADVQIELHQELEELRNKYQDTDSFNQVFI